MELHCLQTASHITQVRRPYWYAAPLKDAVVVVVAGVVVDDDVIVGVVVGIVTT